MKRYEGKIAGILGTIIIHLVAALLFMSVKLHSLYQEKKSEFLIEFQSDDQFTEDEVVEVPRTLEEIFRDDSRYMDIVRNIANQPEVEIDPDDYVDRVKEELIESGMLGEDNFIDEKKEQADEMDEGDTALEAVREEDEKKEDEMTLNEMAASYTGPTRIYYNLAGRHHLHLPIPVYKCPDSGIVVIKIVVARSGEIREARIDKDLSSGDQCLAEAAMEAVSRTRFNIDTNADPDQQGSITFQFVAQ
jgi:TonB family protein